MATFTLTLPNVFPEETEVGAYPTSNWPTPNLPSGAPIGVATSSKKVTSGALAFTGLTDNAEYYAVAEVNKSYRYVRFRVSSPPAVSGKRKEPEEALKNLLAALATAGIITDATTKE
jgi:hypothetical protein